ncbi:MAG: cation transporter, partial [Eubacteriales bacterium]
AAVSAIGFGYLLDFLIGKFSLPIISAVGAHAHAETIPWYKIVLGTAFMALILFHAARILIAKSKSAKAKQKASGGANMTFDVEGMSCEGCANGIKTALLNTKGILNAEVSLEGKTAKVWGDFQPNDVVAIIEGKGYKVVGEGKNALK